MRVLILELVFIFLLLSLRPFAKILYRHCFDFWCGVKFALGRMSDAPGANHLLLRCSSGVDVYQLPHRALQKMIFTPAVSANHFGKGSNGLFAMIEIAVVSSRKTRLRQWAEAGDGKARAALDLVESPNRFLSTTQIGITLVGVLAGAFGGATLAKILGEAIRVFGWLAHWADALALVIVVSGVTYFSLVIGELVPKRIGMGNPEFIARLAARPMCRLAWLASPLVDLLSASSDVILKFLRVKPAAASAVSEEELKILAREGVNSGTLIEGESEMVEAVLNLDSLTVRELMVRRGDIVWLDVGLPWDEFCKAAHGNVHSVFPVFEGRRENILGIISVKDLFRADHLGHVGGVRPLLKTPLLVPLHRPINRLLESFRTSDSGFAMVVDEFGAIVGLVTLYDVMESIIGNISSMRRARPTVVARADGGWLVDAMMRVEDFQKQFPGLLPVSAEGREFSTLSGFILHSLGYIPAVGECFVSGGVRFEVVDLDGSRIDKIIIALVDIP